MKKDQTHDVLNELFPEWRRTRAWFKKDTGLCAHCGKPKEEHDGDDPYFCRRIDASEPKCPACNGRGWVESTVVINGKTYLVACQCWAKDAPDPWRFLS